MSDQLTLPADKLTGFSHWPTSHTKTFHMTILSECSLKRSHDPTTQTALKDHSDMRQTLNWDQLKAKMSRRGKYHKLVRTFSEQDIFSGPFHLCA